MTQHPADWLDSLRNDETFARDIWDALIWLDPVEVVGLDTNKVVDALKRRWYQQESP